MTRTTEHTAPIFPLGGARREYTIALRNDRVLKPPNRRTAHGRQARAWQQARGNGSDAAQMKQVARAFPYATRLISQMIARQAATSHEGLEHATKSLTATNSRTITREFECGWPQIDDNSITSNKAAISGP